MESSCFNEFSFVRRLSTANRVAQLLLGLCLIIGLNLLATKYFKRIDITRKGAFTLAAESKAYIRQLQEPVNIIVSRLRKPSPNVTGA